MPQKKAHDYSRKSGNRLPKKASEQHNAGSEKGVSAGEAERGKAPARSCKKADQSLQEEKAVFFLCILITQGPEQQMRAAFDAVQIC